MKQIITKFDTFLASRTSLAPLFLRLGLATVLLYASVSSTLQPNEWIGYLPPILTDHFDANVLLTLFSIYELLLAIWLLSGMYVRYAALLCAVTFVGIITSNIGLFSISFRDIGLMFAALALAFSAEKTED